jgi:hypothetical protein
MGFASDDEDAGDTDPTTDVGPEQGARPSLGEALFCPFCGLAIHHGALRQISVRMSIELGMWTTGSQLECRDCRRAFILKLRDYGGDRFASRLDDEADPPYLTDHAQPPEDQ